MECVEARAALKSSSFLSEVVGMKPLPSSSNTYLVENIWCATVGGGGTFTGGDDFAIEEYFDISAGEEFDEEEEDEEVEKRSSSSSSSSSCSMSLSPIHGVAHAPELEIPEDMKELETWANLMDDSIPDDLVMTTYPPAAAPISFKPEPIFRNRVPIVLEQPNQQLFVVNSTTKSTGFPAKPRTSRTRKPGSAWLQSHHLKPEPPFSSSSSTSSWGTEYEFSPSLSEESGLIFIPNPTIHGSGSVALSILGDLKKPAKKKQKINRQSPEAGGSQHGAGQLRRCTHCQVQKTPQWRTGPLGPKTLCNACGVRFKSGRLFPEYRPACSPTFSSEVHSNSHRKVLEMRKKKENGEPEEVPMTMTIMSC